MVSSHIFPSPQATLTYRIGKHRITSNLLNTAQMGLQCLPIASLLPSLSPNISASRKYSSNCQALSFISYDLLHLEQSFLLMRIVYLGNSHQFENHSPFIRTYPLGVPGRLFPRVFSTFVFSGILEECSLRTGAVTDLSLESSA